MNTWLLSSLLSIAMAIPFVAVAADITEPRDLRPQTLNAYVFDAVRADDAPLLRDLIAKGVDVESRDERGSTPLILAAYYGRLGIVDVLLEAGADPNAADARGNTALMGALFKGETAVAERLLRETRTDVNVRNTMRQTAAMFAALFGRESLIDRLAERGADFSATDASGVNAQTLAQQQGNAALAERIAILAKP
ncbi:ankyrin repeat domain-containing protein [Lysobacter sp. CFH 32150]|uniref:ankyrin repeat domain-containing protein n=1 Tax=Lysobacter sp. CFH 32150 TaxID=2927128 RepID=UPI001FA76B8D|nr:ankyrin repeat domain-containing protein [Lysobacter sp. CFH 32150]MCI4568507.1 ankyrin repeat domain-containing protein [Lysobacter sp. CFH 32150]